MEYEKFTHYVQESISQFMGNGYEVTLNKVIKNNGLELTGLIIMEEGKKAAPTIYLEEFYQEYRNGETLGELVEKIVSVYEESCCKLEMDFSFFMDFEQIQPRILYKLLNYQSNQKLLEDVPHKRYMDLAIVFYILVEHDSIGNGTVMIHKNHMKIWNVNEQQLYEAAVRNTPRLMPYRFSSMENVVEEIFGQQEPVDFLENDEVSNHDMYILTNNRKMFGAACLLYDNLLKRISDKLRSNLYIIPSSIHELIIIPKKSFPRGKEDLIEMVCDINANEVNLVDILSDNVYEYDRIKEAVVA